MELRQYLNVILKWLWLILISVVIAGGSSYFASRAATPIYRTKTTLMVGRVTQNPDTTSSEIYTGQQLAYTYVQLARREPVLKGAAEALGLYGDWNSLVGQVSASSVPNTQLIEISVVDSDPFRAKLLADAIAQQLILQSPTGTSEVNPDEAEFIKVQLDNVKSKLDTGLDEVARLKEELDATNSAMQIQNLQNQINVLETKISGWQSIYTQLLIPLQGGRVNVLTVVEEANIPSVPISPNIRMNVLLAAAIGLILSVAGAILVEYLDDTIKTSEDVGRLSKLATLGTIGKINGEDITHKLVAAKNPLDPRVEGFRVLKTNLQYLTNNQQVSSLMVTSSIPREGKSVCLANLAVVMAQAGMRVVLVDADFRRPVQHKIFNLMNRKGLSDAILCYPDVAAFLQPTEVENLLVLVSGPLPSNPAKLLEAERMKGLLKELNQMADIVLVDTPPVLVVADAYILSPHMDGVVLITAAGHTRRSELKRSIEELSRVHANVLGVVLNRFQSGDGNYYYYYSQNQHGKKKGKDSRFGGWRRVISLPSNLKNLERDD
jgi:capsular exopolysaccharide synthesis family protein